MNSSRGTETRDSEGDPLNVVSLETYRAKRLNRPPAQHVPMVLWVFVPCIIVMIR